MESENYNFNPNPHCPVIDVDGVVANGKQFDLDITLPKDSRNVIFGTIRNAYKEPIEDAVVKLIEIKRGKDGKKERLPISHTFTNDAGEFVFGPLCPDKEYAIDFWANDVRHYKMYAKIEKDTDCLRASHGEICESNPEHKPDCKPDIRPEPRNN